MNLRAGKKKEQAPRAQEPKTSQPERKKGKVERILSISSSILLIVMLAMIGYMVFFHIQDKIPYIFNHAFVRIQTGSMETEIPADSYILIRKVKAEDIKLNDVITFYSDDPGIQNLPNTHRVMEIIPADKSDSGGIEFITKGDNNELEDKYTAKGVNLIGVYAGKLTLITKLSEMILNRSIFIFLVIIPAAMLIFACVKDIAEKTKQLKIQAKVTAEIQRMKASGELEEYVRKIREEEAIQAEQKIADEAIEDIDDILVGIEPVASEPMQDAAPEAAETPSEEEYDPNDN